MGKICTVFPCILEICRLRVFVDLFLRGKNTQFSPVFVENRQYFHVFWDAHPSHVGFRPVGLVDAPVRAVPSPPSFFFLVGFRSSAERVPVAQIAATSAAHIVGCGSRRSGPPGGLVRKCLRICLRMLIFRVVVSGVASLLWQQTLADPTSNF